MHEQSSKKPSPPESPDSGFSHETPPRPSPRIYVASLSDYNNGVLHGVWIDAARDAPSIHADIQAMLAASADPGAEEYAIHDYDNFGTYQVGEYDTMELVAAVASSIREFGLQFAAWASLTKDDPDRLGDFTDAYVGQYESPRDYADQLAEDLGFDDELAMLPETLQPYVRIDTDALARDMEASGDIDVVSNPTGGVWIFNSHL